MDSITINPENSTNNYYPNIGWDLNNYFITPTILMVILVVFLIYIILFYSLGNNKNSEDSSIFSDSDNDNAGSRYFSIFSVIIFSILIILIFINIFQYFFNVNITAYFKNIFTNRPELDIMIDQKNYKNQDILQHDKTNQNNLMDHQYATMPEISLKKQVFNIPGNHYTYEDAKTLCKAYGSNLANYEEIEDAYKNGAEWCNYGWSDSQMALFPTQQKTFNNLQKIPGHEHDCGRPGINGGYIANPNVKYGVNCYGVKPNMTSEEEELMKITSPYPKTQKDIDFQKKIDYWKTKIDQILISPFNYTSWSN